MVRCIQVCVVFVTGGAGRVFTRQARAGVFLGECQPRPRPGPTRTHSLDGAPFVTTDL